MAVGIPSARIRSAPLTRQRDRASLSYSINAGAAARHTHAPNGPITRDGRLEQAGKPRDS